MTLVRGTREFQSVRVRVRGLGSESHKMRDSLGEVESY